jgi:hypothetical protein
LPDLSVARYTLSPAQAEALRHVEAIARDKEATAILSIGAIFKRAGFALDTYGEAMELVRQHARIVAHFHPDRFGGKPANVVDCLLAVRGNSEVAAPKHVTLEMF